MGTVSVTLSGGGVTKTLAVPYTVGVPAMPPLPDTSAWPQVSCPIDNTGAADVTASVTAWLNELPSNSRAVFSGSYRVDGTLEVAKRSGLLVSGGSFFTDVATTSRTRSFMDITGCTNVGVEGVTFRGANAQAGTSDAAYVASLEAQHFVNVIGSSTGIWVHGCAALMIYGDFVYVGGGSSYVTVTGNNFHNNGRQGCSVTNGHHVWIVGNQIDQIRRTMLDLEPNADSDVVEQVVFSQNQVGAHRLNWVAAHAPVGSVNDVWITDNSGSASGNCQIGNTAGSKRKSNLTISRNVLTSGFGTPSGVCIDLANVDGVSAHGNSIPVQSGRNMALFGTHDCTGVDISGNSFPGGVAEWRQT